MRQLFLVEDDKEIAKNLARLLQTEGFSVTCADVLKYFSYPGESDKKSR